ncbi:hypothetical protein HU200_011473 [Digitaria exilis]|uniref:Uncharacterized protein n=1 Tax=Digitaria exilis TaxID=1010633 RepID=A0A835FFS7_9POAL|nr:hypothetical protein HU200_011473 [Digitaria exilis]
MEYEALEGCRAKLQEEGTVLVEADRWKVFSDEVEVIAVHDHGNAMEEHLLPHQHQRWEPNQEHLGKFAVLDDGDHVGAEVWVDDGHDNPVLAMVHALGDEHLWDWCVWRSSSSGSHESPPLLRRTTRISAEPLPISLSCSAPLSPLPTPKHGLHSFRTSISLLRHLVTRFREPKMMASRPYPATPADGGVRILPPPTTATRIPANTGTPQARRPPQRARSLASPSRAVGVARRGVALSPRPRPDVAMRAVPCLSLTCVREGFILSSPSAGLHKQGHPLLRDSDLRLVLLLLLCCYFASPSPVLCAHHRRDPARDTGAIRFLGSNRCVFTGVRFTILDTPPPSNDYTAPHLLPVRLRRTDCTAFNGSPCIEFSRDIMTDGIPPACNGATDASGKGAPNWAAPEPRLSLKKKFEALSNRGKGSKRKAEAMKQVVTTEETTSAGDMPIIGDSISDWPTSILKEKHIKALEADGFVPAQEISQWRSAYGHEYPTEETEEITYEARRALYVSLPPLDPTNPEEAALLARCVDPGVRDQVRMKSAIEDPDEPMVKLEPQVPEEPQAKSGATSRGTERSKRPAPSESQAPVPKKARTLPKPRARTIPEERAKVSPQPRTASSVEIVIGEIGTSMPQQSSSARRALSEEEILHEIFNPASAPFEGTTPIVEEPCPAGPSTTGQEVEEEFTLGEPEIPMRPSTMAEALVDHMAVEPEAAVPEEPRVVPETTLPEVQAAMPSDPPAPEEAQVEETIAEELAVIEESEQERRDQSSAQPPSVTVTTQAGAEAECSRGKQTEATTPEQEIEEIPRVPQSTGAEEEGRSFRIGSFDPMFNPNPQTFEYILDAEEDEQHIDRGLYHAERAVAYFKAVGEASRKKTEYLHNISLMHAKADRLQKELEREREDRKLQEAEDANMIRTLHLRTKELAAEKEDMKKKLAAAKSELKGAQQQLATAQSKMTDWSNVANRYEEALKTLSADHEGVKEQFRVAVQQRKDADEQLVQILEQQKQLAKNLEGAREENNRLSRDLVQAQKHLADKKVLDEKLEQAARRMSELEEELRLMKKSDDDLAEALNRISQLEKAANPVMKALVPEDPSAPQTFLERLKAMPRQLKAYIKRSSKACLVHVLAVVKSRYPEVDIGKIVEGAEPNCMESAFRDLKQEAEPIAEAIAQSLRL